MKISKGIRYNKASAGDWFYPVMIMVLAPFFYLLLIIAFGYSKDPFTDEILSYFDLFPWWIWVCHVAAYYFAAAFLGYMILLHYEK